MDFVPKIVQITDFTVKFEGFADPVNTADLGFKQNFWHGLQILNYSAYRLRIIILEDNFTDHNLTVNKCGSGDFAGLNLRGSTDLPNPIRSPPYGDVYVFVVVCCLSTFLSVCLSDFLSVCFLFLCLLIQSSQSKNKIKNQDNFKLKNCWSLTSLQGLTNIN